jgi:hypothetical protein
VNLARLVMQDACRLACLSGLDASLVEASRRAADVLGWTQGQLDRGRVFDGLDDEIEAATRAVVTQLPRPAAASSTVAATSALRCPGRVLRWPHRRSRGRRRRSRPTSGGRVVTVADPMRVGTASIAASTGGSNAMSRPRRRCRTQGYQRATNWQWRNVRPTLVMGDNLVCDAEYCGAFTTITCDDQPGGTQAQPGAGAVPTLAAGQSLGCFTDQRRPRRNPGRDLNGTSGTTRA